MGTTIMAIKGATEGIKARRALLREGIKSKLIKLDSARFNRGCGYAVEVKNTDFFSAVALLRRLDIDYTVIDGV